MKDRENSFVSVVELKAQEVPQLAEIKHRGKDWVNYGKDNKYPNFLLYLYENSADHQSIIDGLAQYIVGEGLETNNPQLKKFFEEVNPDENINDIYRKVALDFLIFGGFSTHIIPNRMKQLSKLYWVDFMTCRVAEDEDYVYHADRWDIWGVKPKQYSAFTGNLTKEQLFYFKGNKTRGVYPVPLYNAAIKSIQTDIEIANFHLNNITNGFQVNTIINFNNGVPTEDQKREIEEKIQEKFSGTSGTKIMTLYNESKEKAAEVRKLNADNMDEQFTTLKKNVQNTIFTAHKVTSPALFGVKMEGTGFSKTEYEESFTIFNETIVASLQKVIEDEFYKMFKPYFNIKRSDIFTKPFELNLKTEENDNIN